MSDFTITERTEPFTLDEVFSFIDDTNISKMDAHELKSRIANVVQEVRNQSEEEVKFLKQWKTDVMNDFCKYDASSVEEIAVHARSKAIDEFAKSLKRDYVNFDMLYILQNNDFLTGNKSLRSYKNMIDELAEEMKGGGE